MTVGSISKVSNLVDLGLYPVCYWSSVCQSFVYQERTLIIPRSIIKVCLFIAQHVRITSGAVFRSFIFVRNLVEVFHNNSNDAFLNEYFHRLLVLMFVHPLFYFLFRQNLLFFSRHSFLVSAVLEKSTIL